MTKLERKIRKVKRKLARLDRKLKKQTTTRLDLAIETLATNPDHYMYEGVHFYDGHKLIYIDQTTGECLNHIINLPDFNTYNRISYYLEAYLTTNRDVLEEKQIIELEQLLKYFV